MIKITQDGPDGISVVAKEDITKDDVINQLRETIMSIKGISSGIHATISAGSLDEVVILFPNGVVTRYNLVNKDLESITKKDVISCQSHQFIKQYLTDEMDFLKTLPTDILKDEMSEVDSAHQDFYTMLVGDLYGNTNLDADVKGRLYRVRMAELIVSYDLQLNKKPTIVDITNPLQSEIVLDYPPMHTVYISRAIMVAASSKQRNDTLRFMAMKNKWGRGGW